MMAGPASGQPAGKADGAFLAAPNLHVYVEPSAGLGEGVYLLAPVYSRKVGAMGGGVVFDLAKIAADHGITLGKDDVVLYNPESRVMYFRGEAGELGKLRELYESHDHDRAVMRMTLVSGQGAEVPDEKSGKVLFDGIAISGETLNVDFGAGGCVSLIAELGGGDTVGQLALRLQGPLPLDGKTMTLDGNWVLKEPQKMSLLKMDPVQGVTSKVYARFGEIVVAYVFGKSEKDGEGIVSGVRKELEAPAK